MRMTHGLAVWTMVGCTALWSMAGVVTRHLEEARSFEVTFWRSFFTVVSLLIILPLWQGRGVWSRLPWRNRYFWLSGLCWSVMFTAFMVALTLTAVANVLITMAVGPIVHRPVHACFFAPRVACPHMGGHCAGRYRHWLDVWHPIEFG